MEDEVIGWVAGWDDDGNVVISPLLRPQLNTEEEGNGSSKKEPAG